MDKIPFPSWADRFKEHMRSTYAPDFAPREVSRFTENALWWLLARALTESDVPLPKAEEVLTLPSQAVYRLEFKDKSSVYVMISEIFPNSYCLHLLTERHRQLLITQLEFKARDLLENKIPKLKEVEAVGDDFYGDF